MTPDQKTWTPEEQAEHRKEWVAALRSGEFEQGRDQLKREDGSYCCLGVATVLAMRAGVPGASLVYGLEDAGPLGFSRGLPVRSVYNYFGLVGEGGCTKLADDDPEDYSLTELNDEVGYTFDQIADLIERGDLEVQA